MAEPSASTSQPPATPQPAPPSQTQSQETAPSSTTADTANSTQDPVPKQEPGTAGGEDIDASIEQDIDMAGTDTNTNNAGENGSASADPTAAAAAGGLPVESVAPAPPPTKKETSLREFLGKMDEYAPIVSVARLLSLQLHVNYTYPIYTLPCNLYRLII